MARPVWGGDQTESFERQTKRFFFLPICFLLIFLYNIQRYHNTLLIFVSFKICIIFWKKFLKALDKISATKTGYRVVETATNQLIFLIVLIACQMEFSPSFSIDWCLSFVVVF